MTEEEYINVKDLGHLISAKDCLRHIVPETSDIISDEEYKTIWKYLTKWETKLFQEIKTNEEK